MAAARKRRRDGARKACRRVGLIRSADSDPSANFRARDLANSTNHWTWVKPRPLNQGGIAEMVSICKPPRAIITTYYATQSAVGTNPPAAPWGRKTWR